jgi:hypothetical protein
MGSMSGPGVFEALCCARASELVHRADILIGAHNPYNDVVAAEHNESFSNTDAECG